MITFDLRPIPYEDKLVLAGAIERSSGDGWRWLLDALAADHEDDSPRLHELDVDALTRPALSGLLAAAAHMRDFIARDRKKRPELEAFFADLVADLLTDRIDRDTREAFLERAYRSDDFSGNRDFEWSANVSE